MLFTKIKDYRKKKWSSSKSFQVESPTTNEIMSQLRVKADLYTLKSLNLIPKVLQDKIDYTTSQSITYVYANRLILVDGNISNLPPTQILKIVKMNKNELISFWTYSLSVNNTDNLYNITEIFTTYSGFKKGSKLKVKKKIINYISITSNKVDVLFFDKHDEITRDIYNYARQKHNVSSKNEFLIKLFEKNGKLDKLSLFWKLQYFDNVMNKKDTQIHEETYIWFSI